MTFAATKDQRLWTDRQELTWREVADLFTTPEVPYHYIRGMTLRDDGRVLLAELMHGQSIHDDVLRLEREAHERTSHCEM